MDSDSKSSSTILTPAQAASPESGDTTPLCGICRRQFSRYTCPRCNLLYCSLQCFRAEAHAQCSEPFYRTQLETDIRAEPSKSAAERTQMLSLLKRFEEDALDDPFAGITGEDDENDEDEGELERRLAGLNLEQASYETIWAALTRAERDAFTKAVQDPSSEPAQQLLSSPELADTTVYPWWEAPSSLPSFNAPSASTLSPPSAPEQKYGISPPIIPIPPALLAPPPSKSPTFPLAYNLVTILIAYAYATRRFAVSPLQDIEAEAEADARAAITRVVPFLADRRSTTKFNTLEVSVTDAYSRFEQDEITTAAFAALLHDVAALLRPQRVAVLEDTSGASLSSHPSSHVLRALADLQTLFAASPAAQKLAFYAAQLVRAPAPLIETLHHEVEGRASAFQREGGRGEDGKAERARNEAIVQKNEDGRKLVEEIS